MKKTAPISGLLLLCMYGVMLLHNLLPHVHTDAPGHPPGEVLQHVPHHHHAPGDHAHGHDHSEGEPVDPWSLLNILTNLVGGFDHQPDHESPNDWYVDVTINPRVETTKLAQCVAALLPELTAAPLPILTASLPVRPPPLIVFPPPTRRQDLQRGPPSFS